MGYRPHEENAVLQMPTAISVAVLPNAPHARLMATRAHSQGREVLIHMPMAPLSKQPLERDTLQPSMSSDEIQRIIRNAVNNVPYAVGMNNHMGSAMTSSLPGMQKVMQALESYRLYFLDSMTIGSSQATRAAAGTGVKVIKRKVFLDDTANEADIRRQFNRAVELARRNGSAIAIGHPRPATVKVLQQMLPSLPADIVLVKPRRAAERTAGQRWRQLRPAAGQTAKTAAEEPVQRRHQAVQGQTAEGKTNAGTALGVIADSIASSPPVTFIKRHWQHWTQAKPQA